MVIGIVAVLAMLLLPALQRSREQARSSVCRNNMRQLAFAVQSYAQEKEDDLPWSGGVDRNLPRDWVFGGQPEVPENDPAEWKKPEFGIHAESGSLFTYVTSFEREEVHSDGDKRVFPTYRCPSTGPLGAALRVNYSLNAHVDPFKRDQNGLRSTNPRSFKLTTVIAPSQKVMFVGEAPERMKDGSFEAVNNANSASEMFQLHAKSSNFSFFDGSVHSILGDAMLGVIKTMDQLDRHFNIRKP